jgi:hypothetical protein
MKPSSTTLGSWLNHSPVHNKSGR